MMALRGSISINTKSAIEGLPGCSIDLHVKPKPRKLRILRFVEHFAALEFPRIQARLSLALVCLLFLSTHKAIAGVGDCVSVNNHGATFIVYQRCITTLFTAGLKDINQGTTLQPGIDIPSGSVTVYLNNSGTINSSSTYTAGFFMGSGSQILSVTNGPTGQIGGGDLSAAFFSQGTIGVLDNYGTIQSTSGRGPGIINTGTIENLNNYSTGIIRNAGSNYGIYNSGNIIALTNLGSISGNYSINNIGTINNLNNIQNGTSPNVVLTYCPYPVSTGCHLAYNPRLHGISKINTKFVR
jgi:hypothetical protein